MMKKIIAISFFAIAALPLGAQPTDTLKRIDDLFSQWNNATPGGSIAVSRDGKILYHKAFGLADLEHAVPNTTETIFESGSVAKQFTALAALMLESEGKLSLQDDVRKYVPELPTYPTPVKIIHLLNHTSGLKDWGTIGYIAGWPRTTKVYTQDIGIDIISKQKSLNFTPGSEYSYSNSNYTLLVAIVERVSKQPYTEFSRTRLFEPLGMKHTQWRSNFRTVIPNRAIAYSKTGDIYQQEMPFENIFGHGGLLTTTGDLLIWNKILETHVMGGDAVAVKRIQKGKLNNGTEIKYAAGLFLEKINGFDEIGHSGATAGYRAWLAWYPKKRLSVVALSNDGSFNSTTVGRKIAELFLGKETPATLTNWSSVNLTDSEKNLWTGIYRSIRNFDVFTIEYKNHELIKGSDRLSIVHKDTLRFGNQAWIKTTPNQLLMLSPDDSASYVRVTPPVTTPDYLKKLEGDYHSAEADASFRVEIRGNEVWINRKPGDSFLLTPSFRDGFLTKDNDLYEFKRDKAGNVIAFEVSTSRAERVPFIKSKKK